MKFVQKDVLPAWKKLYDLIHDRPFGAVVSYVEIDKALNGMYKNSRQPIYKCCKTMELNDFKTLVNERGKGYRVAKPLEHIELGKGRVLRSSRQLFKGKRVLNATDTTHLSVDDKQALRDTQARLASILEAANKRGPKKVDVEVNAVKNEPADVQARDKRIEEILKKKKPESQTA
jgi:hypothetical protein